MDDVNEEKDVFQSCPKLLEETILNYRNDVNHVTPLKVDLCFVDIALQLQNLLWMVHNSLGISWFSFHIAITTQNY
jgi:hypothetical protein